MSGKVIGNRFFEKIRCVKNSRKAYASVIAFLFLAAVSFPTTFAISRIIPSSEKAEFAVTIQGTAGGTSLEDRDVKDISIFYATGDDPVFSDRLKLSKDEILSSDPTIIDRKHVVQLPNDIVGIRVDIALDDALDLEEDVFPDVKLKLNKAKFYGDPRRTKRVITSRPGPNHYSFELGKRDVVRNRTPYSWRVLFSLFFIVATALCALLSIGRGIFSHSGKIRLKRFSMEDIPSDSLKAGMIVSFLLFSIFPVFKMNPDKDDRWENRTLEILPERLHFDNASSCFSQVERYFDDRFFGRNFLIGLSDTIKTTFGNRSSDKVLEGEDDWLFYYETLPETKHANFRKEQFLKAGEFINKHARYAAAKGKRFVYVICPDKFRIHGDELTCYSPDLYLRDDIVDEFVDYLKTHYDFPVIYQRQELLQKKTDSGHDLFYRYDTHWTEEGAYYGLYLPLLEALSIPPVAIDKWTQKESQNGDLIAFLFGKRSKNRIFPPHQFFEPVFDKTATVHTVEDPHIPNPEYDIILSDNPNGVPHHILFLRDSFMNAAIDIFANTFQQAVFIRRYRAYPSDLDYIDRSDIIVLEHVERLVYQLLWQEFELED